MLFRYIAILSFIVVEAHLCAALKCPCGTPNDGCPWSQRCVGGQCVNNRATAFPATADSNNNHASGENITLSNGVIMPTLAFGANVWSPDVCKQATLDAIDAGFKFIWSSALIGQDCQAAQGDAIGPHRSSLFVAGTVNSGDCSDQASCYLETKKAAEGQFTTLNVSKLDMLMLDYPSSAGCDGISGQWKAFSELYSAGKVRTIAVSNFDGDQLKADCLGNSVKPTVNQLSYSVGMQIDPTVLKYGIVVQAYSPLGSGGLASDPLLQGIGKAHGKSAAQVALKWILQHNATINTQSTEHGHLVADHDIFDFTLSAAEMAKLDAHNSVTKPSDGEVIEMADAM